MWGRGRSAIAMVENGKQMIRVVHYRLRREKMERR